MLELIDDLNRINTEQIPAVLCIVTSSTGSTPRKAGSKMLVYKDGSIKGTVGGGAIELQVIQDARQIIEKGIAFSRHFELYDDLKMQCGGTMEVYFEPIGSLPKLYIFGGGHIGKALAGYAAGLGFHTLVIDPREGIFDNWSLTGVETRCIDYFKALEEIEFSANTYSVIVTHQHEFDEKLLHLLAVRDLAYLGMIGSRRKVTEISKHAIENGILTNDILDRIDMPIGIPFEAETPAEIAISIVAKLIDVKNKLKKA
ncbi:MAG: XdhC family protein [Lentimicrobium sp.]|nr:XdhC family protein [Lentimicrobium sp.]